MVQQFTWGSMLFTVGHQCNKCQTSVRRVRLPIWMTGLDLYMQDSHVLDVKLWPSSPSVWLSNNCAQIWRYSTVTPRGPATWTSKPIVMLYLFFFFKFLDLPSAASRAWRAVKPPLGLVLHDDWNEVNRRPWVGIFHFGLFGCLWKLEC